MDTKKLEFATADQACSVLGVSAETLRRWSEDGRISVTKTVGGHRRYNLKKYFDVASPPTIQRKRCIIYARVSTRSQKDDLERQIDYLRSLYPYHECIKDIGSGLNFKRKGLERILEHIINNDVQEIVVTHRDRLCRFGFALFEKLLFLRNPQGRILVLNQESRSREAELVDDLLSIITVFSGRLYGLRSHTNKKGKISNEASLEIDQDKEDTTSSNPKGDDQLEVLD